ncbi:MAG: hypothetical protein R3338_05380 [Thermoanaerobaculia bacterium]|nr:hypothetical protein [Thermoanaerobaculia bacterium]
MRDLFTSERIHSLRRLLISLWVLSLVGMAGHSAARSSGSDQPELPTRAKLSHGQQPSPQANATPSSVDERSDLQGDESAEQRLGEGSSASISFVRHFLGIVAGVVDVELITAPEVATVELLLNGESAGLRDEEPWEFRLDLGNAPEPREMVAIARNHRGREIDRVRQWLNLPRPWAEIEVLLSETADQRLVAHVGFASVGGDRPLRVNATLDGEPLEVSDPSNIPLPDIEMETLHVLRVEALFADAGIISHDVVIGGSYVATADTQLSSVAADLGRGEEPSPDDVQVFAGDTPASVVAVDQGPADLIVIVDPAALRALPEVIARVRPHFVKRSASITELDEQVTPAEPDVHLRLLWPVGRELLDNQGAHLGYRLFPSSARDDTAGSEWGLLSHLAAAEFPSAKGPVRLADAVAVAGTMAVERGRRRAVVLLHGGSPAEGSYTAEAARNYLEQLNVPLVVWSLTRSTPSHLDAWEPFEVVANLSALRKAWAGLLRKLDHQRILWVEGLHLPQTLRLEGTDLRLAGRSRN